MQRPHGVLRAEPRLPAARRSRAERDRRTGMVALVRDGISWPIGATLLEGGVNCSVYSKHSTELQLLLFDHVDDERPARVVPLDPAKHRSYHYWHIFVPGLKAGQVYGYRARGHVRIIFDPRDPP